MDMLISFFELSDEDTSVYFKDKAIASDAVRAEKQFMQSFPGWDYVEDYYKKAGLEDILAKRRLWEKYDREKYDKTFSPSQGHVPYRARSVSLLFPGIK